MNIYVYGNKTRNASRERLSGDISFYYRHELKQYTTIVQKEQCGIIWVKLSAEFPFDRDVFICHIYKPPTSPKGLQVTNNDIYDQLETHMIKYKELGTVYATGDLI